jgi:hypothetical protein
LKKEKCLAAIYILIITCHSTKIYNLSPFSRSLWKNIGIFERNRINKKRRNDRYKEDAFFILSCSLPDFYFIVFPSTAALSNRRNATAGYAVTASVLRAIVKAKRCTSIRGETYWN